MVLIDTLVSSGERRCSSRGAKPAELRITMSLLQVLSPAVVATKDAGADFGAPIPKYNGPPSVDDLILVPWGGARKGYWEAMEQKGR